MTIDDIASADEGEDSIGGARGATALDLTPRTGPSATAADRAAVRRPGQRKWPWIIALVAIIGGIGFIASKALNDATLFFYNTDEAVAKRSELGTKPFRLQGTVVQGTTARTAEGVSFTVTFNGVEVPVNHIGDPPELFQDCIPVVLEGRWASPDAGAAFASNRILVKHSENYDAANPERLAQAEASGVSAACLQAGKTPPTSAPAGGTAASP